MKHVFSTDNQFGVGWGLTTGSALKKWGGALSGERPSGRGNIDVERALRWDG